MLGIPLGMIYSNVGEWLIHKYLLHGQGRNRESMFAFHWHDHHKEARRHGMYDPGYEAKPLERGPQRSEVFGLLAIAAAHLPFVKAAPFFTATVWFNAWRYYNVHKRAHLDPAWGRENLPWHYDHHMGPDQDMNWCVTYPWFDQLVGTRQPYAHTEREASDRARASEKAARKNATKESLRKGVSSAESAIDSAVGAVANAVVDAVTGEDALRGEPSS